MDQFFLGFYFVVQNLAMGSKCYTWKLKSWRRTHTTFIYIYILIRSLDASKCNDSDNYVKEFWKWVSSGRLTNKEIYFGIFMIFIFIIGFSFEFIYYFMMINFTCIMLVNNNIITFLYKNFVMIVIVIIQLVNNID